MTFGILGNLANKGPCDSGFHIPTKNELISFKNAMFNVSGSSTFRDDPTSYQNYLFFPPSYYLNRSTGTLNTQYGIIRLWSCTMTDILNAYAFYIDENNNIDTKQEKPANGFNIRAFKDEPERPDSSWTALYESGQGGIYWNQTKGLISLVSPAGCITIQDHNVGATTVWQPGDTVDDNNAGLFYQFGNNYGFPYSGATEFYTTTQFAYGYGPENPYLDSHFVKVSSNNWFRDSITNLWGGTESGTKILTEPKSITYMVATGREIWHNPTLGLVSITSDFGATWLTIADRDLGATTAGGQGSVFQWGNNYAFPATGTITTTSTRVDASSYSTSNPYISSSFYRQSSSFSSYPWWTTSTSSATAARNLWGQGTIYQGPCDSGFHIPSSEELTDLNTLLSNNSGCRQAAYMVSHTYRTYRNLTSNGGSWWSNRSSTDTTVFYLDRTNSGSGRVIAVTPNNGFFIRPFYNQNVIPTTETGWTRTLRVVSTKNINQIYAQSNKVRPPEATKIVLNAYTKTLAVGDTFTLKATLQPEATKDIVSWSSSDTTIATVGSSTGKITAVASGTATITVITTNGLTATCTVTVTA